MPLPLWDSVVQIVRKEIVGTGIGLIIKTNPSIALPQINNLEFIKEYGKVLDLKVDSQSKEIRLNVLLNGENEPIEILIKDYSLRRNSSKYVLIIKSIQCSRKWITTLAREFLEGREFSISSEVGNIIEGILSV